MTMDRSHGRAGQLGQTLQHALAVADRIQHAAGFFVARKLVQVRTGNEASRFAGADDQALGRIERQAFDDLVELIAEKFKWRRNPPNCW